MPEMIESSDNAPREEHQVRVAKVSDVEATGCLNVQIEGHTLALFADNEQIYAVDNRCPHMGFPLHRGTVNDGILTCHWHHARFDLASGGTFDQWADDVRSYPVQVRDGEVWIDLTARVDLKDHYHQRLRDGLERNIPLVIAKSAIFLLSEGDDPAEPFRIGLDFGVAYRQNGWGMGLTMLGCMMNLLPHIEAEDKPAAIYHGLSAVALESNNMPPHFRIKPLPSTRADASSLKRWFRRFVEVRDDEGAERCIVSAIRAGASHEQISDMLFAAATDHRYIQIGHVIDFTNKALEALDIAGWEYAERVLASLAFGYATADRMEESNAWRNPVDLIHILELAFDLLPEVIEAGKKSRGSWDGREELIPVLLGEDPQAIADGLLEALRHGSTEVELAGTVTYVAALRIARFHTSNEFPDWDTALHTFTFANAVHQGLGRFESQELLRGVFDAAMSVYLDRFLNVPAAKLPEPKEGEDESPERLLEKLPALLDRQQQVNESGELVARYFNAGGDGDRLMAVLGKALLNEDRDFHTIQMVEAAYRQYELLRDTPEGTHVLIAASRYLAAHAPTVRAQRQTYEIARRLHKGERLDEGT